jgi:hypothetical protein
MTTLPQVARRYTDLRVEAGAEGACSAVYSFAPSDPDFPFDVPRVFLSARLPPSYPREPCMYVFLLNPLLPLSATGGVLLL